VALLDAQATTVPRVAGFLPIGQTRWVWKTARQRPQNLQIPTGAHARAGTGIGDGGVALPRALKRGPARTQRGLGAVRRLGEFCHANGTTAGFQGGAARVPRHPMRRSCRTCCTAWTTPPRHSSAASWPLSDPATHACRARTATPALPIRKSAWWAWWAWWAWRCSTGRRDAAPLEAWPDPPPTASSAPRHAQDRHQQPGSGWVVRVYFVR